MAVKLTNLTLHLRNGRVDPELILTPDEIEAALEKARRARSGAVNPAVSSLIEIVRRYLQRCRS